MNFGKVVPLVSRSPHFLEIIVGSLGGGTECVDTLSFVCAFCPPPPQLPSSDTLCSLTPFGPPSPTPKIQFEIKFNLREFCYLIFSAMFCI